MKNTHKLILAGIVSCSLVGVVSAGNPAGLSSDLITVTNAKTETVKLVLTGLK